MAVSKLSQKLQTPKHNYSLCFALVAVILGTLGFEIMANPVDIRVHTVSLQQIEDLPRMDVYADLSKCRFIAEEFDVRIVEHDSLISVLFPDRRYDFFNSGDTVLLVGEEGREAQLSFPDGLILSTGNIFSHDSKGISGYGRYRQSVNISAELGATLFPAKASDLVTPQCDTLTNIRFDHVRRVCRFAFVADSAQSVENMPDSLVITSVTDTYSLTAVDEEFPRVLKRIRTLSGHGGETADSATYMLVSSPLKSGSGRRRVLPESRGTHAPGIDGPDVSISSDGRYLTITSLDGNENLSLGISDIAGRVMIARTVGGDGSVVDISSLSPGEYLIRIISGGETVKVVKFTNRRP